MKVAFLHRKPEIKIGFSVDEKKNFLGKNIFPNFKVILKLDTPYSMTELNLKFS